jgi:hypothetical protein
VRASSNENIPGRINCDTCTALEITRIRQLVSVRCEDCEKPATLSQCGAWCGRTLNCCWGWSQRSRKCVTQQIDRAGIIKAIESTRPQVRGTVFEKIEFSGELNFIMVGQFPAGLRMQVFAAASVATAPGSLRRKVEKLVWLPSALHVARNPCGPRRHAAAVVAL